MVSYKNRGSQKWSKNLKRVMKLNCWYLRTIFYVKWDRVLFAAILGFCQVICNYLYFCGCWNISDSENILKTKYKRKFTIINEYFSLLLLCSFYSPEQTFWKCSHFGNNLKNECLQIHGFQTKCEWKQCIRKFKTEPNLQFKI